MIDVSNLEGTVAMPGCRKAQLLVKRLMLVRRSFSLALFNLLCSGAVLDGLSKCFVARNRYPLFFG